MKKVESIIKYYLQTTKLKDVVRSGWKYWHVKKERLESVAEHIYGTCMLAIGIWSQTLPPVNLSEVLLTLAIHETEEIIIGDLTPFDKGYQDKLKQGKEANKKIFSGLVAKEVFENLLDNFNNGTTPEGIFAKKCDKLECDLQSKIYDEENCVDLSDQKDNPTFNDKRVQDLLKSGRSFSEMWLIFGQNSYNYDKNFTAVSNYALDNNILEFKYI